MTASRNVKVMRQRSNILPKEGLRIFIVQLHRLRVTPSSRLDSHYIQIPTHNGYRLQWQGQNAKLKP